MYAMRSLIIFDGLFPTKMKEETFQITFSEVYALNRTPQNNSWVLFLVLILSSKIKPQISANPALTVFRMKTLVSAAQNTQRHVRKEMTFRKCDAGMGRALFRPCKEGINIPKRSECLNNSKLNKSINRFAIQIHYTDFIFIDVCIFIYLKILKCNNMKHISPLW